MLEMPQLGHGMKILLIPYIDEDRHIRQKPINFYSHTKHSSMIMSQGTDF